MRGGGPECSNQSNLDQHPNIQHHYLLRLYNFLYAWGYSSDDRSLPRKPSTAYTLPVNCGCSICSGLVLRLISVSFGGLISGLCLQLGLLNWPFYLSNGSANASRNLINYCHCLESRLLTLNTLSIPILHPFNLALGFILGHLGPAPVLAIYLVLVNILRLTNDIATQMTQCRKEARV